MKSKKHFRMCFSVLLICLLCLVGGILLWRGNAHRKTADGGNTAAQETSGSLSNDSVTIPTLLYHHLCDTVAESDTVLSSEHFRADMELLNQEGYTPISLEQLRAYVFDGVSLPEKPVLISFDDGYYSNYELAFPILKAYQYPAVIFVIGCSVGHYQYYKDTQYELTPHFGKEEISEMTQSGLITIQSHTYDMHQYAPYENHEPVRTTICSFENETEEEYRSALIADAEMERDMLKENGVDEVYALAFPKGMWEPLTNTVLVSEGIQITFTTDPNHINTVICGNPESLLNLGRLTISDQTTKEDLLLYLSARS